eukprot:GHVT01086683.1.p1 GENE.GHVT01086683.1~~GHVT01086683.1.p1  ORF type:complete len:343 (+),score=9.98 GHVT01086683.1:180-1208(+)
MPRNLRMTLSVGPRWTILKVMWVLALLSLYFQLSRAHGHPACHPKCNPTPRLLKYGLAILQPVSWGGFGVSPQTRYIDGLWEMGSRFGACPESVSHVCKARIPTQNNLYPLRTSRMRFRCDQIRHAKVSLHNAQSAGTATDTGHHLSYCAHPTDQLLQLRPEGCRTSAPFPHFEMPASSHNAEKLTTFAPLSSYRSRGRESSGAATSQIRKCACGETEIGVQGNECKGSSISPSNGSEPNALTNLFHLRRPPSFHGWCLRMVNDREQTNSLPGEPNGGAPLAVHGTNRDDYKSSSVTIIVGAFRPGDNGIRWHSDKDKPEREHYLMLSFTDSHGRSSCQYGM